MKEQYIKVSDFLKYCADSAKVSRDLYNKCLDQAIKGPSSNLTAAAFFDQQTTMYEYNIPNVIQNIKLIDLKDGLAPLDTMPIEATELCRRTKNILIRNDITMLNELIEKYEFEILKLRNMSSTGLQEIKVYLKGMGLALKGKVKE